MEHALLYMNVDSSKWASNKPRRFRCERKEEILKKWEKDQDQDEPEDDEND